MEALVSIITPTYNSDEFILQTIRSVQSQTYQNWELIIVDDASKDSTVQKIEKLVHEDSRIIFFRLESNRGPGIARQRALDEARGQFIAFLDADDIWKPNKIERQIEFLKSQKLSFTFSSYESIDEKGLEIINYVRAPKQLSYNMLFFGNFIGNLTGIYDAQALGKIPISNIKKRQDWIMWLDILKKIKKTKSIQESLAFYRVRTDSISSSKRKLLKYNFNVYRTHHKLSFFTSILAMTIFLFIHFTLKRMYIRKSKKKLCQ